MLVRRPLRKLNLVWNGSKWRIDPFVVEESGILDLIRNAQEEAKKKQIGPAMEELLQQVTQAFRILFTRALKGVYVWVPDPVTRTYLQNSLGPERN
jgi:DUF2075 family protein